MDWLITALCSRPTSANPNRPYQGTSSSEVPRPAQEHPVATAWPSAAATTADAAPRPRSSWAVATDQMLAAEQRIETELAARNAHARAEDLAKKAERATANPQEAQADATAAAR